MIDMRGVSATTTDGGTSPAWTADLMTATAEDLLRTMIATDGTSRDGGALNNDGEIRAKTAEAVTISLRWTTHSLAKVDMDTLRGRGPLQGLRPHAAPKTNLPTNAPLDLSTSDGKLQGGAREAMATRILPGRGQLPGQLLRDILKRSSPTLAHLALCIKDLVVLAVAKAATAEVATKIQVRVASGHSDSNLSNKLNLGGVKRWNEH